MQSFQRILTIKIDAIVETIDPRRGLNWAEVIATIPVSPTQVLRLWVTRPVDMHEGDAGVHARVRSIIENNLPQISGKV